MKGGSVALAGRLLPRQEVWSQMCFSYSLRSTHQPTSPLGTRLQVGQGSSRREGVLGRGGAAACSSAVGRH